MSMPHLPPIAAEQLATVERSMRTVLRDDLVALYLYGSAVRGGLRGRSDLDILAISARRLTVDDRRGLIEDLLATSRSPAHPERRHLEVTIVAQADVRPWRYPPPMELQYGDWWRTEFAAGDLAPWTSPNPDLAVLLTCVLDEGVAIVGPPPRDVIDTVPRADLVRALRDVVPELLPGIEDDDTRNSLLTLARVWLTLETGRIEPKDVAASWALARLPGGAGEALRRARDGYLGLADDDPWTGAAAVAARRDAAALVDAIDGAAILDA